MLLSGACRSGAPSGDFGFLTLPRVEPNLLSHIGHALWQLGLGDGALDALRRLPLPDCGGFRAWRSMRRQAPGLSDCATGAAPWSPQPCADAGHTRIAISATVAPHEPKVVSRAVGTITPGITATATSMGTGSVAGPG
jgi:hypothetical protein